MSRADDLAADARRRAHELMSKTKQQEAERLSQRDKERQAEAAKTARLKELRLAKEAADAAAAKTTKDSEAAKEGRKTKRKAQAAELEIRAMLIRARHARRNRPPSSLRPGSQRLPRPLPHLGRGRAHPPNYRNLRNRFQNDSLS
jgi:hypothetical protein